MSRKTLLWIAIVAGVYTVAGLQNAVTAHIDLIRMGHPYPWWKPLTWELTSNLTIAALVPLVRMAALRFRFTRERWFPTTLQHLGFAIAFSLTHVFVMVMLRHGIYALHGQTYDDNGQFAAWGYEMLKDVPTYVVLVLIIVGFDAQRRYREREMMLARAQAERLEAQLQPHFLFNTLNAISSLMYDDVRAADRMIARLSEMLRILAEREPNAEVRLAEEMELVTRYIDMMQLRLGDRLSVELDVDDAARDAVVPHFILQPLVENAIQHGIAQTTDGGRIELRARRDDRSLVVKLRNDGPPLAPAGGRRGVGLRNTAERLANLYGDAQKLEIADADVNDGGGVTVTMTLPYRAATT